jgi:preprotein translocase subunit SecA
MLNLTIVLIAIVISSIFTLSFFVIKRISGSTRVMKSFRKIVKQINALEPEIQNLSDQDLLNKTQEFKQRLQDGETLNDILVLGVFGLWVRHLEDFLI